MQGASAIHMNIFGLNPVVVFGTEEQKQRNLPPLIAGKEKSCFAVTEPNVGLDTTRLKTRAVRDGNAGYKVDGAQDLDLDRAGRRQDAAAGAYDRRSRRSRSRPRGCRCSIRPSTARHVEVREIEKMGRKAVDSNQVFFDGFFDPDRGSHRRGRHGLPLHPRTA